MEPMRPIRRLRPGARRMLYPIAVLLDKLCRPAYNATNARMGRSTRGKGLQRAFGWCEKAAERR